MSSKINVNLKPCTCGADKLNAARRVGNSNPVDGLPHTDDCHGSPILIPCPIPRSVTFQVRLGKCVSPNMCKAFKPSDHVLSCPACPIPRFARARQLFRCALAVAVVLGVLAAFEVPGARWACACWWLVVSATAAWALWLSP